MAVDKPENFKTVFMSPHAPRRYVSGRMEIDMKISYKTFLPRAARYLAEGILPLLFWVAVIFGFDAPHIATMTILSALIHELGHIAFVILFSDSGGKVSAHISGFRIKTAGGGYIADILILLGGVISNILVFLILLPFNGVAGGYPRLFGFLNLLTAISNLLPVEGYDGYGVLEKIISMFELFTLLRLLEFLSFLISILFTFVSLYLLLRYGEGYWIFGMFFTILMRKLSRMIKTDILRE